MEVLYDNERADPLIAEAVRCADDLQRARLGEIADRLVELGALREGIGRAGAADVLWYYLGQSSWRRLRRMGWSWQRAEEWLAGQVAMALLRP